MKHCTHCGISLEQGAHFCPECGTPWLTDPGTAVPPVRSEPPSIVPRTGRRRIQVGAALAALLLAAAAGWFALSHDRQARLPALVTSPLAEKRWEAIVASDVGVDLRLPAKSGRSFLIESCEGMQSFTGPGALAKTFMHEPGAQMSHTASRQLRDTLNELTAYAAAICPGTAEAIGNSAEVAMDGVRVYETDEASQTMSHQVDARDARLMVKVADDTVGR